MKIHIPVDVATGRWKWLGLLIIIGALLPMDNPASPDWAPIFTPLLGYYIAACWHRSSVALKAGLAFGAGCAVFLHRELPLPGAGYGFFNLIAHSVLPSFDWKWLLVALAINAVLPMLIVVFSHFLILACPMVLEFLNAIWRTLGRVLFDIPAKTGGSPLKQARIEISS